MAKVRHRLGVRFWFRGRGRCAVGSGGGYGRQLRVITAESERFRENHETLLLT